MKERFGSLGQDMSRNQLNDSLGDLNAEIERVKAELVDLGDDFMAGKISEEETQRRSEVLDQQLSIATYRQQAYLSRL